MSNTGRGQADKPMPPGTECRDCSGQYTQQQHATIQHVDTCFRHRLLNPKFRCNCGLIHHVFVPPVEVIMAVRDKRSYEGVL